MIVSEDLGSPYKDDSKSRKGPIIGDFKIRMESSWASSDSGETCVTNTFTDAPVINVDE